MSRRIDIELTSALADGSWTWRAAGARKPNGVLDGSILPDGAKVGDEIKVEMEQMLDGVEILSVVKGRQKTGDANVLEILPSSEPFEAVIETRARRSRPEGKSGDRDRPRRDNRNRDDRDRGDRKRDDRSTDDRKRDDRGRDDRRTGGEGRPADDRRERAPRRERPHFEAPPELPQRPKPKRLRPGKARRNAVLAEIPEEQRPLAELASQGMAAVRTRVKEENAKLEASGQPTMPEASVLKMAEELLPKLRVADWLDRAEAAQRQMDHLDLRDLRSVIASGDDSTIARDETARALNIELKAALVRRQDEELHLWIGDIDAALGVGRVIRALRLSSQPPKAGVMFPPELARRLGEAAGQSLQPTDSADRWIAVLEAAAFSPVRSLVVPASAPETISDDLRATVIRLGPALPQIATLLVVEIPAGTPQPKPLRPNPRQDAKRRPAKAAAPKPDHKPKAKPPEDKAAAPDAKATPPEAESPSVETTAPEAEPATATETTASEAAPAPESESHAPEPDAAPAEPVAEAAPAQPAEPDTAPTQPDTQSTESEAAPAQPTEPDTAPAQPDIEAAPAQPTEPDTAPQQPETEAAPAQPTEPDTAPQQPDIEATTAQPTEPEAPAEREVAPAAVVVASASDDVDRSEGEAEPSAPEVASSPADAVPADEPESASTPPSA